MKAVSDLLRTFFHSQPSRRKREQRSLDRRARVESLESRTLLAGLPYGAMTIDTAEYMLGSVTVTPVLLESDGTLDASTENWNSATIDAALAKVGESTEWWRSLLAKQTSVHTLDFTIDTTYALRPVETKYEPISRISNDYALWGREFLDKIGFRSTGTIDGDMFEFNNSQRIKFGTDWAFTIFIVNSTADGDGMFEVGGDFLRAFAFSGGLFYVVPSTRPASSYTHETGHIFWAFDEYAGGDSVFARRGYYNTPNTNAAGNPTPGFAQQASIMASGNHLLTAYANVVSPASTLALIGWQDSDGDGIFDVLDVPLELSGTGFTEPTTGNYRFRGNARVGTLPNKNTEGLRNDISINRISRIEVRFDGGDWTILSQPNVQEATLDLTIPIVSGSQNIEIRAVDAKTGITSNVFSGRLQRADSVTQPGINGFVWVDNNKNGLRDVGEYGEAGWTVELLGATGQTLNLRKVVEPDNFAVGPLASGVIPGISIRSTGSDADGRIGVANDFGTSTGTKSFSNYSRATQGWSTDWPSGFRRMQIDFAQTTQVVEIDAIGSGFDAYGRMDAFDANGNLIDRYTTSKLDNNQSETMRVSSANGLISYVVIGGHAGGDVRLDHLRYGAATTTTTGSKGQYTLSDLPTGTYMVKVTPSNATFVPATSTGDRQTASVVAGSITNDIDFAFRTATSDWQNPNNRFDVTGDGKVVAFDALLLINELNRVGSRALTPSDARPPYFDVSGDGRLSSIDALLVINYLNRGSAEGEGASQPSGPSPGFQSGNGSEPGNGLPRAKGESSAAADNRSSQTVCLPWLGTTASGADEDWSWATDQALADLAGDAEWPNVDSLPASMKTSRHRRNASAPK